MLLALVVIGGYLAGSIPFGVLFARARGVDLTHVGSGNIGATNVGKISLCDAAKGALPVYGARALEEAGLLDGAGNGWGVAAVGAAAFLGHITTPWLGFHGGKGVATAFGVFVSLAPPMALAAGGVFLLVYRVTHISSLGSLLSTTLFVPGVWLWTHDPARVALALFMWVGIVVRHRGNIARLWKREEAKVERI